MTSTAVHLEQPELPLDHTTEDPVEPGRPAPTDPDAPSRRKGEPGPGGGEEESEDEEATFVGVGTA